MRGAAPKAGKKAADQAPVRVAHPIVAGALAAASAPQDLASTAPARPAKVGGRLASQMVVPASVGEQLQSTVDPAMQPSGAGGKWGGVGSCGSLQRCDRCT